MAVSVSADRGQQGRAHKTRVDADASPRYALFGSELGIAADDARSRA